MAQSTWQPVVEGLERRCAEPTAEQRALAAAVGVVLEDSCPAPVAAARLRTALRVPLELALADRFGSPEYDTLVTMAESTGLRVPALEEIESRELLNAWLRVARDRESAAALRRLQPRVDDVAVVRDRSDEPQVFGEVASISASGRINFRGGRGRGCNPYWVARIVRDGEGDYPEMLRRAREHAAAGNRTAQHVSHADLRLLDRWRVESPAPAAAVEALEQALVNAEGEAPMQRVLEQHPALLAGTVPGNHGTWVRPEVGFGNNFRADFLVAGLTSLGLRWLLVELESPLSRLSNPGDRRATTTLRHAVDQIEDWRAWLAANLAYARLPREEHGLGLPGITAEAQGLIIMAREDVRDAAADIRELKSRRHRIEVRTYDWLLRLNRSPHPMRPGLSDVFDEEDGGPGPGW